MVQSYGHCLRKLRMAVRVVQQLRREDWIVCVINQAISEMCDAVAAN